MDDDENETREDGTPIVLMTDELRAIDAFIAAIGQDDEGWHPYNPRELRVLRRHMIRTYEQWRSLVDHVRRNARDDEIADQGGPDGR